MPYEHFEGCEQSFVGQLLVCCRFCDPEVNHDGQRLTFQCPGDKNIRRLDIAMDDSFLVRVLNCMTNLNEKVQALFGRE